MASRSCKYKSGDLLGILQLIELLLKVPDKGRQGVFKCPDCENNFTCYLGNAITKTIVRCSSCLKNIKTENLVGKVFGKLTVLEKGSGDSKGKTTWICQCDCGNKTEIAAESIKRRLTKSCGCLQKIGIKDKPHTFSDIELYKHPLYQVYSNMLNRCYNPKNKSYSRYGGRGILVCEEWLNSYENFYNDNIDKYICNYQIDRKDNNESYEPNNVRWVSKEENMRNSSATKLSWNEVNLIRNSKLSSKELAKTFNIEKSTILAIKNNKLWKEETK